MNKINPEPLKKTGLVVDDENIILVFLSRLLSKWQFNTDTANNPHDVTKIIQNKNYDFILLDVRMPGMNGLELYTRIKEIKPELADRIIFITGDAAGKDTEIFIKRNKIFCVPKPIDAKKLKNNIDMVLSTGKNTL
jgi:DNA-binding NtrC family response regulator